MQPPSLPIPTSQLTEKEGWVGVEVGNGGFPTTCNVESNLEEEDWELGLIWLQTRQGVEQGLSRATSSSTQGFLLLVPRSERDEKGRTLKTRL